MNIDLRDVAEELGLEKENGRYYCPIHDEETPDLDVEAEEFGCFAPSGPEGGQKAVSLVMHVKDSSKSEALDWLSDHFTEKFDSETREGAGIRKALNQATHLSKQELEDSELLDEICDDRNLEEEDILKHNLGLMTEEVVRKLEDDFTDEALKKAGLKKGNYFPLQGRLLVPFQSNGSTKYFIGRSIGEEDSKYQKLIGTEYNEDILYKLQQNSDKLIVTEGPFDAISAYKAGFDVVATVTNTVPEKHEESLVDIAGDYEGVFLAFDGDKAGRKGRKKTAELLLRNQIDPKIMEFSDGQDLDDYTSFNGYELEIKEEEGFSYLYSLIEEANKADDRSEEHRITNQVLELIQDHSPAFIDRVLKDLPATKPSLEEELENIRKDSASESSEQTKEIQEGKTGFKELEIGDETLELVPSTEIRLQNHEFTLKSLSRTEEVAVQADFLHNIYSFSFGSGIKDEDYYLFVQPDQRIVLGEKKLPLKPIDLQKQKYEEPLRQKFEMLKKRGKIDTGFQGFRNSFIPAFTVSGKITDESAEKVYEIENEALRDVIAEYLDNGFEIDPTIKAANYPKLIIHDRNKVRPQDVATYAPHTFLYTNTKVGKSYTGERIGELREKVSVAGLLGFADAEGVNEGILDGLTLNFYADETTSKSHETNLNDRILSLLEKGEVTISQAGRNVTTRFYGSISYLGNPINQGEKLDLNHSFVKIIEDLGDNVEAMGSRLGLVIIDMELNEAEGSSIPKERARKLETFINWIQKQIAPKYSEIEEDLHQWLETGYPEDYLEDIDLFRQELVAFKLRDFWKSHKQSYRHARGQALRMAVYEKIPEILKDEYEIDEVRELADEKFEQVMAMNLRSLRNMADLNDRKKNELRKAQLEGEEPRYLRYFVYSVIWKHLEKGIDSTISINQLRDCWLDNNDELDIDEDSKYDKWAPIRSSIEQNFSQAREKLDRKYGIWITQPEEQIMLRISQPDTFQRYVSTQTDGGSETRSPRSPGLPENSRRVKCGRCGQVQSTAANYGKCVECGSFDLNNITGDKSRPEPKEDNLT